MNHCRFTLHLYTSFFNSSNFWAIASCCFSLHTSINDPIALDIIAFFRSAMDLSWTSSVLSTDEHSPLNQSSRNGAFFTCQIEGTISHGKFSSRIIWTAEKLFHAIRVQSYYISLTCKAGNLNQIPPNFPWSKYRIPPERLRDLVKVNYIGKISSNSTQYFFFESNTIFY